MSLRIICIYFGVLVVLAALPASARREVAESPAFVTSDRCIACHSSLHTSSGEDVSIGYDWRATMMANSARDPYWHAGVRREVTDHPSAQAAIEDKCSTCHMPMARFDAVTRGGRGEVLANIAPAAPSHHLAFDGVSCTVCHQIKADNLGTHESLDGGFEIDRGTPLGPRPIYGPHAVDAGRESVMRSAAQFSQTESSHMRQSELCATCHTLYTTALDDRGEVIGELPEQVPYQEWQHSEYRETRSCQSCHMPPVAEEMPISSILGTQRPPLAQHTFRGGNAFMLGILNKYRGELGVAALPQELDTAIRETKDYLGSAAARVAIESAKVTGTALALSVRVDNLGGHKLPTAYPARRVWLHVRVIDDAGAVLFESGAPRADGSIVGNDNDEDALKFEAHYGEITRPDQVQIYESIMVDRDGRVTTGLLRGVRYAKDNRLLPRGFDKATADAEVAVHGDAERDADFVGGSDRLGYRVDLGRAVTARLHVEVTLLYQSIGYRWNENLRAYDAAETQRFVRYYQESAAGSALPLADARTTVPAR
jgi:hypothetical protein